LVKTPAGGIGARSEIGATETGRDEYQLGWSDCVLLSTYDNGSTPDGRDQANIRSVRKPGLYSTSTGSSATQEEKDAWKNDITNIVVVNPFDEAIPGDTIISAVYIDGTYVATSSPSTGGDSPDPPDPPPSGGEIDCAAFAAYLDGRCCEHSATDRCNYKCEAIKSLSLDDGAGRTWRQGGRSVFGSSDCIWLVPVIDQNCVKATAEVERTANGWKVTILGTEWESTAGPTPCTGEDTGLTATGGGTGSVKYESEGNCPTTGCCEELPGAIVPRITISGIPEVLEHSRQFVSAIGLTGQSCNGLFYDRLVSRFGNMNGVFHGPPMIENPLGSDFGLVWEDNINICQFIDVQDEFYKNGVLECINYGIPCDAPSNAGELSSYTWTQNPTTGNLTFTADIARYGQIESIAQGAGCFANNGQTFDHAFNPMSCVAGSTWRDYEVVYTDTVRFRFESNPDVAGQTCFDIEIVADFVEA
jgi:hypothetical protein